MRHALTALGLLVGISACASPGMPPGGPTVSSFPRVIASRPDTNARNTVPGKVLLRYDDVIGEQFNGGPLSRGVIISPWDGEPRVEWRRTGMTIRPRGDWRANTAYRITVLPGVGDLRNQPSPFGYSLVFSTGDTIPTATVRGVAFDWAQARPLAKATIRAVDLNDSSLVYVTVADSVGRFELETMQAGTYMVIAIDEKTINRALDPREAFDTVRVILRDSARVELYAFVHDTMPARISELRPADSVTIAITLDKPLRPGVPLRPEFARVVSQDSTVLQVLRLVTPDDERVERARADSVARAAGDTTRPREPVPPAAGPPRRTLDPRRRTDTLPVIPPPVSARPKLNSEILVKLGTPLVPGTSYRVTLDQLQNLLGISAPTSRVLPVPRAPAPDSTRRSGDRPPGTPPATPPDSTPRPAPPAPPVRRP